MVEYSTKPCYIAYNEADRQSSRAPCTRFTESNVGTRGDDLNKNTGMAQRKVEDRGPNWLPQIVRNVIQFFFGASTIHHQQSRFLVLLFFIDIYQVSAHMPMQKAKPTQV
jgi:hypothetical protein